MEDAGLEQSGAGDATSPEDLLAGHPHDTSIAVYAIIGLLAILTWWALSGVKAAERAGG